MNLLNHTSGLGWGIPFDTGDGDDALAAHVAKLSDVEQIAPPGARASYSQAAYNLAGRVVQKVTGLTYERAVAALLLEPLGLAHSFYALGDAITRRFAVGHNPGEDGTMSVARLWKHWRGNNPGAGLASSVADQIRWAVPPRRRTRGRRRHGAARHDPAPNAGTDGRVARQQPR